jgi:hypothetical protein
MEENVMGTSMIESFAKMLALSGFLRPTATGYRHDIWSRSCRRLVRQGRAESAGRAVATSSDARRAKYSFMAEFDLTWRIKEPPSCTLAPIWLDTSCVNLTGHRQC